MQYGRRADRLRPGVLFAFLALFSQMLVALLPMPAMAGMDGLGLCQTSDQSADHTAPSKSGTAPSHGAMECPVCQAFLLGGSLVPPSTPAIALPRDPGSMATVALGDIPTPRPATAAHRARAPPASA